MIRVVGGGKNKKLDRPTILPGLCALCELRGYFGWRLVEGDEEIMGTSSDGQRVDGTGHGELQQP